MMNRSRRGLLRPGGWSPSGSVRFLFLAPALGALALFYGYPLVLSMLYSLFDLQFSTDLRPELWSGLANYQSAFENERFLQALFFTGGFTLAAVSLDMLLGAALGYAAFAVHRRLQPLVRTLLLIPWAIPPVIQGSMWRWILNSDTGPLGNLLVRSGLLEQAPLFLGGSFSAAASLVVVFSWKGGSISALFFMAGLAGLPRDVFDAAKIDGAGRLRTLISISLPLMSPVLLVALLYRGMDALRIFDLVYALTGGGPGTSTDTLSSFSYAEFFRYARFGEGSAHAMIMFFLTLLLAVPLLFRSARGLEPGRMNG